MGHTDHAAVSHGDDPILLHQFDDVEQQSYSSTLGMWIFLATEVMFFGGLLTAFAVYRVEHPREIALASHNLIVGWGFVNTIILLTSSLTMALAVRASQLRRRVEVVRWMLVTMVLGTCFLGVKAREYTIDYHEHLIPGLNFQVPEHQLKDVENEGLDPRYMQMFFVLYFFMTMLHAIHLVIGVGMLGIMAYLVHINWFSGGGAVQIEVGGLYWHFIDIVWVFLFPLLYLISGK